MRRLAFLLVMGCAGPSPARPPPRPAAPVAPVAVAVPGAVAAFLDDEPEGPFPSLDAYCAMVLARPGNDAERFCDVDSVLAQRARVVGLAAPYVDARFVAHDGGGDFVRCSLAVRLASGWYVLTGFECENTMNEHPYEFAVTTARQVGTRIVVAAKVRAVGYGHETYAATCGVGASGRPRCVAAVTSGEGGSSGVSLDEATLTIGPETIDEGSGFLRSPWGLVRGAEAPPGRYPVVFP